MDKLNELDYFKNRSLIIIDFMLNKNDGDVMMLEYKRIIEDTFRNGNLKGLKTLSRDVNAWAKGLPEQDLKELEEVLTNEIGENLSGDKITHKIIEQTIKNRKISNKEQYRVIHEYLQDISEGDPFFDRISELQNLIESFKC